jgi:hypothetical protein
MLAVVVVVLVVLLVLLPTLLVVLVVQVVYMVVVEEEMVTLQITLLVLVRKVLFELFTLVSLDSILPQELQTNKVYK